MEDVNKTTDTQPECLADEAYNQNNSNEEVMEVHDGSVIDSCIAAADDGQDVHDA
jgi:hypothetical protein